MDAQPVGYASIANYLRTYINDGSYEPGSMLPSEWTLCRKFGVKRTAVRRAFIVLECEGLIITVPAKGRMVRSDFSVTPLLYRRIARDLREKIRRGDFVPECPMPSEATLCRHYSVSRNTVRRAMSELEREGIVVVRHGFGRFIRSD
ncbi:winged helix-turn-helix domain-containing protein [Nonomuraea endophytica]|uniref:winged helix-turn-helix domain-containing protein n=1 Tax=Nonomuraea endophytica TaxID=714136 RepID=UPI00161FBDB8|nr:GntR family transcriptional regulator [Nonomuraea endophytica]